MARTEKELTTMLHEITRTQATVYYKSEESNPDPVVVRSVFMLCIAAVTIAFARAGVDVNSIAGIPEEVASQMELVGWNLEAIKDYFNMD